ncbi:MULTISPECIES: molybdenum cofactor guanylyltransferase MobA [Vibrio]|uniref:Molybdenum cofactor guanylyltransferase n=2 Tax=Vibrio TaxID=662 RepID=A0A7X4LJX7_9VIBR|nr:MULTISPECIES: molybdenum cofactor guanylyltransferase MobA [Vibrio]MBF9000507.1 molybdenum cofactor guanylyltransferase MobA [Vibrio nitrifigilis]MZI93221.1 molybdenum cofactor guanylyltransferase MobA [Vibrio eleionomae]
MLSPSQTTWVILAGGQASRMGGHDKGLVQLNQMPLIEHVIERLRPQTSHIVINANRNLSTYQAYAPVIKDLFSEYPGPLAGMHAGLTASKNEWVGFVPCDCPRLHKDLVTRFCAHVTDGIDVLVATDGDKQQPVFALMHRRVLPKLTEFLQRGERKLMFFIRECRFQEVDFSDAPECFLNLNTPQELAKFGELTQ